MIKRAGKSAKRVSSGDTDTRRVGTAMLQAAETADPFVDCALEHDEEPVRSEHIVVTHEPDLPALREHLRDLGSRTMH